MRIVDSILLSEIIAKLPDGYREAIILHDIEGLQHSEIAEMKGRSIGTSKSQLHKGRAMLRALMRRAGRHQRVYARLLGLFHSLFDLPGDQALFRGSFDKWNDSELESEPTR